MPIVHLKYLCHILVATGKFEETLEIKGKTVADLVSELDRKYPGLKSIFIPPENGIFNIRTMIHIKRVGKPAFGVVNPDEKLKDGDTIVLW